MSGVSIKYRPVTNQWDYITGGTQFHDALSLHLKMLLAIARDAKLLILLLLIFSMRTISHHQARRPMSFFQK